jgi:hypothetical protein
MSLLSCNRHVEFFSMAQHLEIEKKFLIKQPPAGWKRRASTRIEQGYFPVADKDLEIRLRRKGAKHFITVQERSRRLPHRRGGPDFRAGLSRSLAIDRLSADRQAALQDSLQRSDH